MGPGEFLRGICEGEKDNVSISKSESLTLLYAYLYDILFKEIERN